MAEAKLHDAQISNYDHAQGTPHCRRVEQNLGMLIPDEWKGERISSLELYILSSAAALHDSGKRRRTSSGDHGKVAAAAIAERPEIFGLDPPEAAAIQYIIGVHNNRQLDKVPESLCVGVETVHLRDLAAIFCLADTLHCDYTRVLKSLTEEEEANAVRDPLTLFRLRTYGFDMDDYGRIWLEVHPQVATEKSIIDECFRRMLQEMNPILATLHDAGYPYEIFLRSDDSVLEERKSVRRTFDGQMCQEGIEDKVFIPNFDLLDPSVILYSFENKLRLFIQTSLQRVFGQKWWKDRISQDVQDKCKTRKEEREIAPGCSTNWPEIYYADFLDYARIITKRDNWREVFREFFMHEEWVRVKLQELNPIRADIAHNREVNAHDLQKLRLSVVEMLKCIASRLAQKNDMEFLTKLGLLHRVSDPVMEEQVFSRTRVDLPIAEYILRKGESKKPGFFKREPEWVDFEEGYIVEHKNVDAIIHNLAQNPVQLILGAPASGKSVMLKNIAFKLAKQGWKVYFVELKKYSEEQIKAYLENALTVDNDKALIILDDAHLDLPKCEDLVRNFKLKNLRTKLLIGLRTIEELQEEHPKEVSSFDGLAKTEIVSSDEAEKIIRLFLRRKYELGDTEMEKVARKFTRYEQDLWVLSWALDSYSVEKNEIRQSDIYKKVMKSITNMAVGHGRTTINAEDALLPLSTFYRFEIVVERVFLEEQLNIKGAVLDQLVAAGEIASTIEIGERETLRLDHSSIAELYFETYQVYPDLGVRIKRFVQRRFPKWDLGLLHLYFESKPERVVSALGRLSQAFKNGFSKDDLVQELLSDNQTRELILEGISEYAQNTNRLIKVLAKISDRKFSELLLTHLSKDHLIQLWRNSRLNQIGLFLGWRGYYSPSVRRAYTRFSMESSLLGKMNEATLDEIRGFIHGISQVRFYADALKGQKLARNAVDTLRGLRDLSGKVRHADISTVSLLIKNITDINSDPQFIIDGIKPPFDLGTKLSEASLNDINMLIHSISKASADPAFVIECIKRIEKSQLLQKIEASSLQHINHFITNIKKTDVMLCDYVLGQLEQLDLESKLQESDLKSLSSFLWNISPRLSLSARYAAIADNLDLIEKIEETDLMTVNYFLWNLLQTSPTLPKTFIDDQVRTILVNRINQEDESLGEKLLLIGVFQSAGFVIAKGKGDGVSATEISRSELESWLKESSENPFRVALMLNGLKTFDEEAALSFLDSYPDLESIVRFLKGVEAESAKSRDLIVSVLHWLPRVT